MKVIQVYMHNNLRNFNYIVYSEVTKEAIFFDPYDLDQTLPVAKEQNLYPRYLINTHAHHDHIKDNEKFLSIPGVEKLNLKDGEEFLLSENEKILCRFTPGHIADHFCYFLYQDSKLSSVIVGDTVFNAGVGNCKNGGDVEQLYTTIRDIFLKLPDDIVIYPSHDYFETNLKFAKTVEPDNGEIDLYLQQYHDSMSRGVYPNTTIGDEKKMNPFFRVFRSPKESKKSFINLRQKRDKW